VAGLRIEVACSGAVGREEATINSLGYQANCVQVRDIFSAECPASRLGRELHINPSVKYSEDIVVGMMLMPLMFDIDICAKPKVGRLSHVINIDFSQ
jgi:hypothetical protein